MALSSEDRRNQGREAAPEQDGQGNNGDNIGEWSQEDLQEELKKLPGYVDRKTNRLRREQFDAMDTSPLVRHFVANITDSSPKGLYLKRTQTDPGAMFGGEDTFVRTPSRLDHQDDIYRKWVDHGAEAHASYKSNRHTVKKELHNMEQAKKMMLMCNNKAVSQFVEDLVELNINPPERKNIY
eukprot:CAMPEP_0196576302 /NCGR_PEP_ID=MMETSP1081-20130531/5603_1 /TAXON_ID=36882 /ORGANISM="Pyramimonas amylifera, Strain CCMP720" /LENGTH=181 /DNA_ID=CAMNT_0041894879 /DNA_START=853 /DNA_END=1398 /DNA_ORIENTATION=-